jgi:NDP-sugar pyrophosphorylase family protein
LWCCELKALILAGGYATRLRPLSYALPKLLFPVAGRPVLEQTIEHLSSFGVDEVILAVNYLADQLREYFGDEYRGVRVRYSLEPKPLGTGGPIAFARRFYSKDETLLVMNGDVLSEIDLNAMKRLHESSNALATIALHEVDDPSRFGVVRLGEHSRIREFVEKPKLIEAPSRLINAGVYLMQPQVIDRIPEGRKVVIEREVFPALADEGGLFGYIHSGTWFDIGSISDFRNANFALLESKAKDKVILENDANTSKSAKLTCPALVGDRTTVEDGANIGPLAIIGRRVQIRRNARVTRSIVFDDVEIGTGASIEGAVIGNSVRIGAGVEIQQGSVIAGHASIHDNVRIARDVYVHPYKEINQDILSSGHVV